MLGGSVNGGGERLALVDSAANETDYYSYNQHGDVEALTTQSGATTASYGYTAYGADVPSLETGPDVTVTPGRFPFNSYRFGAERVDPSTSNLDLGYGGAAYDPSINGFLSRAALANVSSGAGGQNGPLTWGGALQMAGDFVFLSEIEGDFHTVFQTNASAGDKAWAVARGVGAIGLDVVQIVPVVGEASDAVRGIWLGVRSADEAITVASDADKVITAADEVDKTITTADNVDKTITAADEGAGTGGGDSADGGAGSGGKRDLLAEARAARDALGKSKQGLPWKERPAVFIGAYDEATGEVGAFASETKVPGRGRLPLHAEDVARQEMPNAQLTEPMGWRRLPGATAETWDPIEVCPPCQLKYPPSLFPPGTEGNPNGWWYAPGGPLYNK